MFSRMTVVLALTLSSVVAFAAPKITVIQSENKSFAPRSTVTLTNEALAQLVQSHLDLSSYSFVRVQLVFNAQEKPDHVLVYLSSAQYHKLSLARLDLDQNMQVTTVTADYHRTASERQAMRKPKPKPKPTPAPFPTPDPMPTPNPTPVSNSPCPDATVQFIAFAPNDMDLEQQVTEDVAKAAEAAGLKVVRLLKEDATRDAYLNYMTCPNLVGNFYDGDANPEEIVTNDGSISADDMKNLKGQFQYKVTNIWLACEAYNDPMLSAVTEDAQAQKYAAGVNNLLVGPSDKAAACTMKAAIAGQPMQASFDSCYKQFDSTQDQWGFSGHGSDMFGQKN